MSHKITIRVWAWDDLDITDEERATLRPDPEDPDYILVELPAVYEVCDDCRGEGRVLIEAIREHAYSWEEMNEDPDFSEEYMKGGNGMYGTTCPTCAGRTTVLVVDHDAVDSMVNRDPLLGKIMAAHAAHCEWAAREAANEAYERRMGY